MSQSPSSPLPPTAVEGEQEPEAASLEPQEGITEATFLSALTTIARRTWGAATTNRKVAIGSSIVGFFVLVAIFGPLLINQDPLHYTPGIGVKPPSSAHWLGTNQANQDVFIQLVYGTRTSLFWAFLTGLLVLIISVSVGLVSGYFGGVVDDILSVITNVFLVIPSLPLAIVAVEYFSRTVFTVAVVVALTNWPWGARVLRAQTLSMRGREFVTASRSSGERPWRIIFFEIFPNEISIVAASFVTTSIQVMLAVAGLEFLGFGNSSTVSWGTMLYDAYNSGALLQEAWWWFAPPGLCIALVGAGLALLNFGIDELADPRLRQLKRRKWPKKQRVAAA
ncbi:MAG TPA: ABC transporter permease [Ktedonobacterales bacterium]|jgi:peptide/nickel transport system permease protein